MPAPDPVHPRGIESSPRSTGSPRQSAPRSVSEPTVLVSNPMAEILDVETGRWVVSGTDDPAVLGAIVDGAGFEEVRSRAASIGDFSLLHLDVDGVVTGHRGITAHHEVFYLRDSSGRPLLTDLFRNAVAKLDVDERTVTEDILADHLLYRNTPMGSYLDEVGRLGHGETLRWDPAEDDLEVELQDTLSVQPRQKRSAVLEALESVLADSIPADQHLMLSGGVDSTLIGTFLPSGAPSVSAGLDSPELEVEIEYAKSASDLLGTDHCLLRAKEAEYLAHLESTIETVGMPLQQSQTPIHDVVFKAGDADAYLNGLLADSVFGMGAGLARLVWYTRGLRHLPPVNDQLSFHREFATRLVRPVTHPQGYAGQMVQYLDQDLLAEMIPRERIEARQQARMEYMRRRVPLDTPTGDLGTHLEWGQWIEYFCENSATSTRQVALARGKSVTYPFANREIVELATSLPSPQRYLHRFTDKHVTKGLLASRLPEYPTHKSKQNGNMPVTRFFADGPLADVFDRYEIPAFVPDSLERRLPSQEPALAWVLTSYAIWRDLVLENDDLSVTSGTRRVTL